MCLLNFIMIVSTHRKYIIIEMLQNLNLTASEKEVEEYEFPIGGSYSHIPFLLFFHFRFRD